MTTSLYQEFEADTRFKGDTNTFDGEVTVTTLKLSSGPTGTVGAVWTTAPPAFDTYQKYITCTAGSTVYRIPVFDNA